VARNWPSLAPKFDEPRNVVVILKALKQFDTWLNLKLEKPLATIYTKVAKLCMEQTQFLIREAYYQQTFGTAMGNALSPFIANLFMRYMENKLKRRRLFPRVWVRYVDDVLLWFTKTEC
jgi:hypothetical protein